MKGNKYYKERKKIIGIIKMYKTELLKAATLLKLLSTLDNTVIVKLHWLANKIMTISIG